MIFFFKQKTAYEMRISDWSSDMCSSDLGPRRPCLGALLDGPRGSERRGRTARSRGLTTESGRRGTMTATTTMMAAPPNRAALIAGHILSGLVIAFLLLDCGTKLIAPQLDRKSTRLNSSH